MIINSGGGIGDNITKIIISIISALSGALGLKLIDKYLEYRNKKEKNSILWNLSNLAEIHTVMRSIIDRTDATRVLIIRGSNGGGIPKPGSEFYISVIHEEHKQGPDTGDDLHTRYRGIKVDGPYIEMLMEMMMKGQVKYKIAKMVNGTLKNIYLADGIKYSEIHHIKNSSNEMFYLGVSTTKDTTFNEGDARVEIDLAVDKVKQVFAKY